MAVSKVVLFILAFQPIVSFCYCQNVSHPAWHLNFLCFFAQNKDFLPDQSYMLPAYEIAIEEIRQQYNVSASLSVITAPFLKGCDDLHINWYLVAEYYYRSWLPQKTAWQVPVLFLNGCDEGNEIAKFTREWDILMIATTATPSQQPRQPEAYSSVVSFATFDTTASCQGIFTILAHFGWTTVFMIHDTWLKNSFYSMWPWVVSSLTKDGSRNAQFNIMYSGYNSSQVVPYEELLRKAMNVTRVIMIMFRGEEMRSFMIAADRLGMLNGEYIFLAAEPFENARRFGSIYWYRNDSSDMVAKRALRHVMKFTTTFKQRGSTGEKDTLAREIKELGINEYGAWYTADERPNPGPLAAYLAVKALGRTVAESSDTSWTHSATSFAHKFHGRRFISRGVAATIDSSGVRVPVLYLEDFNPEVDSFETAVIYEWNPKHGNPVTMAHNYSIDWATSDKLPPLNVPLCGYRGDAGPCAPSLVRSVLMPLLIICVLVAVTFFAGLAWYLRRQNMQDTGKWWILDEHYISQVTDTNSLAFKVNPRKMSIIHPTAKKFHLEIPPDYIYKSTPVVIKKLQVRQKVTLNRAEEEHLEKLGVMDRSNLVRLCGFLFHPDELWCVYEFLAKGHLKDLIEDSYLDWDLCILLSYDLINGVRTIHRSVFKQHGYVTPYVCMISKNLTLKVADCGLYTVTSRYLAADSREFPPIEDMSKWFASEVRHHVLKCNDIMEMAKFATSEADVYSVASIILWIFKSCRSFSQEDAGCTEILDKCLNDNPPARPGIDALWSFFQRRLSNSGSLIENMIKKMDNYARKLEDVVKERTVHLQKEQQLTESLLSEMLPKSIIHRLLTGQPVVSELYPSVTVAFSVFDGFTGFVAANTPLDVVEFLGDVFSLFDDHSAGYDVYKVETISDIYMVVSGLPIPNGIYHATEVCTLAVNLRSVFLAKFLKTGLQIMIGIHSGECAAGLVGTQRPRYCLFGDTVNVASRLASHNTGFSIQTTLETVQLLSHPSRFQVTERGLTELKGTANRRTFWLDVVDTSQYKDF